ncbi:MAG: LptF/LptG family permease [Deltaproteobacteria bacterium]|nr:LptF/LptG family permease [Deltaproteobacteria bacterium]
MTIRKIFTVTFIEHLSLSVIILLSIMCVLLVLKLAKISSSIPLGSLTPFEILDLTATIIPTMLDIAVPVSIALAGCAVTHKMSAENAISALRSLGYSPGVVIFPCLMSGFFFALSHAVSLNVLRPMAHSNLEEKITKIIEKNLYQMLRPGTSLELGSAKIHVENKKENILQGIKILMSEGDRLIFISANSATLSIDKHLRGILLKLEKGFSLLVGTQLEFEATDFNKNSIVLPTKLQISKEFKRTVELTNPELFNLVTLVKNYIGKPLEDENLEDLSKKLQIKFVNHDTIRNKLVSLKKEITRRLLAPVFDVLLVIAGAIMGFNLLPKRSQSYFPLAYLATVVVVTFTILLGDFLSEKFTNLSDWISEGYVLVLLSLGLMCSFAVIRIQNESKKTGFSAFFQYGRC